MPPPKELPGFYYDTERNRYFPIRGPIPGTKRRQPAPSSSSSSSSSSRDVPPGDLAAQRHQIHTIGSRKRMKASELLYAREMHGGVIFSDKSRSSFKQQYQFVQASQPVVWKYRGTTSVADSALEQLCGIIQTPNGLREAKILATGSVNGSIRLYGIENALVNYDDEIESLPEPAWPLFGEHRAVSNSGLASIWSSGVAFSSFSSSISSIKRLKHRFPDRAAANSVQHALVATLGSGGSGGSVYVMNLSDPMDLVFHASNIYRRNMRVASFDRTVWTADCGSDGTQAVIGTNSGSALLNLETRAVSWLYHSKSDVFSQQFVQSGNVVLCGLRNGAIFPVDLRKKHPDISSGLRSPSTARRTLPMPPSWHHKKWRSKADRKASSSRDISMASAVCSLVALSSDEHYFLGSSMDGSVKLFDLRLLQKGAVQSYEGHVNSHTHLPLAVDPSETLVMSGGEDCMVRIWSIKTGELIFAQNVADTIMTTLCWPQSSTDLHDCRPNGTFPHAVPYAESRFDLSHSWGAWMGSRDGLFYMHGT